MSQHTLHDSPTELRALKLLGDGVPPTQVALAIGVDPSRISQLLALESFSTQVVQAKYEKFAKHLSRDASIDEVEDALIAQLKNCISWMTKPMEIVRAFALVNSAKRRSLGSSTIDTSDAAQNIVNLSMPTVIHQSFTTNINNQVIQVGERQLVTMPSSQLRSTIEAAQLTRTQNKVHELLEQKLRSNGEQNEQLTEGIERTGESPGSGTSLFGTSIQEQGTRQENTSFRPRISSSPRTIEEKLGLQSA